MKLYYLGPIVPPELSPAEVDARLQAVIVPIATLVHSYLRKDTCEALVGLRHKDENGPSPDRELAPLGDYRLGRFESEDAVLDALINMGDCNAPTWFFNIRSMISCRAVMYGYDAQAFLCLRTEDEPPVSPDPTIIIVEQRPDLLMKTDYLDGAEVAVEEDQSDES